MVRLFLMLMILSSCSFHFRGSEQPASAKKKHYQIHFRNNEWVEKKDERSDYIFENKADGRIMLSNSFCGEFQDQSLEKLAQKTFRTVNAYQTSQNDYTSFKNREAYRITGSGKVDGVKVHLQLLNTRRNDCYFDFMSISPAGTESNSIQDFDDFLQAVEFK